MDSINDASKFGGDAWLELQAFKTRQINRRERLNRHKDLVNGITTNPHQSSATTSLPALINARKSSIIQDDVGASNQSLIDSYYNAASQTRSQKVLAGKKIIEDGSHDSIGQANNQQQSPSNGKSCEVPINPDPRTVECLLLLKLCDVTLKLPIDSRSLRRSICRIRGLENTKRSTIENLLEKLAHQELITIEEPSNIVLDHRGCRVNPANDEQNDERCIYVISADHTKLVEFDKSFGSFDNLRSLLLEARNDDSNTDDFGVLSRAKMGQVPIQAITSTNISSAQPSHRQRRDECIATIYPSKRETIEPSSLKNDISLTNGTSKATSSHDTRRRPASDDVESLLSLSSTKERESKKLGEELLELLSTPTAKEKNLLERFRSADGYQVQEFCPKGTKDECRRNNRGTQACDKLHFKKIIAKHTEESLGDCSFLNTCFHMDSCKYVHYEVDFNGKQQLQERRSRTAHLRNGDLEKGSKKRDRYDTDDLQSDKALPFTRSNLSDSRLNSSESPSANDDHRTNRLQIASNVSEYTLSPEEQLRIEIRNIKRFKTVLYPPQWIQCDLRYFDMSLLGKFSVIMADPPWDIHMELPYGTMSDDEMRKLNIPALQDEGVIFLWVTGRAMELGRECLALWGYERCDEIIWVKTNQLQRIIRTGRTGHWLNHGKEHCLVGIKGNPTEINRGLDCDIVVAEVRATSHKPDEIYGIIERLSPGTRKIELFGRAHNVQPNWITLGNQLNRVRLVEPNLIEAFKKQNLPYQTTDQV